LVTQSPQHGYLEIQSITSDDEYNSKVFDQSTINSEKMFYIQAGVNQSSDCFMFDVTNGIYWLRDLVLKIVTIPENLYVKTQKLVVEEGRRFLLLFVSLSQMSLTRSQANQLKYQVNT
jgi:chondroitin sulfate proteoglycan 4